LVQETDANKIHGREVDGRILTARQLTTAAGICAVLDLLAAGRLVRAGFVRQEDVPLPQPLRLRL
jgi:saccharopine dehydrogenase-like NADP-dependent oxidoreductase